MTADGIRRLAVVDLGSNSFRLVVFSWQPGRWWAKTDEIHEIVRVGAGADATGALQSEPAERALRALELFAHFRRALGLDEVRCVATSAIREASNRDGFLAAARERSGLDIRVLEREEEARFGWLAAVNTTSLRDGAVLDIGGGSLQVVRGRDRRPDALASWALGAVRMTERFLPGPRASRDAVERLREHVRAELASAPWLPGAGAKGRLVGLGGTVRNLTRAAQLAAGLPAENIQGQVLGAEALDALIEDLAARPASERDQVPGIKAGRGEIILAGAIVVRGVLAAGGFAGIEATEAGLREGVFFDALLHDRDPPLLDDVRQASVRSLAGRHQRDLRHPEHVAKLALRIWDGLAAGGLHEGDPEERELLWAGALLHDVGMAVSYDDHHKHSAYLVRAGGLHGWTPREAALVALLTRYHRKGRPALGEAAVLARPGDAALLERGAILLRLAEHLERARDGLVRDVRVEVAPEAVRLELVADGDPTLAHWAAGRQGEAFARAFGRDLVLLP